MVLALVEPTVLLETNKITILVLWWREEQRATCVNSVKGTSTSAQGVCPEVVTLNLVLKNEWFFPPPKSGIEPWLLPNPDTTSSTIYTQWLEMIDAHFCGVQFKIYSLFCLFVRWWIASSFLEILHSSHSSDDLARVDSFFAPESIVVSLPQGFLRLPREL